MTRRRSPSTRRVNEAIKRAIIVLLRIKASERQRTMLMLMRKEKGKDRCG